MRSLEFRAWDGKKMIDDVIPASETSIIELYDRHEWQEIEAEAVEQYTGLKDKNGNEIYENDILEDGSGEPLEYWLVRFEDGKFIGSTQGVDEDIFELTDLDIVGNIHENGDLLEELK